MTTKPIIADASEISDAVLACAQELHVAHLLIKEAGVLPEVEKKLQEAGFLVASALAEIAKHQRRAS